MPSRWLFLLKFDNFGDAIHKKIQNARCTPMQFFVEENLFSCHPKIHGPRNYLQSFYLAALIHKCRKYIYIHMLRFEILLQAEGQDNLRKKMITMELLVCLLMMNSHPNIRKVMGKISMTTSMHLWRGDAKNL